MMMRGLNSVKSAPIKKYHANSEKEGAEKGRGEGEEERKMEKQTGKMKFRLCPKKTRPSPTVL